MVWLFVVCVRDCLFVMFVCVFCFLFELLSFACCYMFVLAVSLMLLVVRLLARLYGLCFVSLFVFVVGVVC